MYTLIIMGTAVASAAMTWAIGYIRKCEKEFQEVMEEEYKDYCRDETFATWLMETNFKEEERGWIYGKMG